MGSRRGMAIAVVGLSFWLATAAFGQSRGTLRGTVTLGDSGQPIHHVSVTLTQLGRATVTDESGNFEFADVPPGRYDVIAHLDRVPDAVKAVEVKAGEVATAEIQLRLTAVRDQVTVTASGTEETTFNSIQSVNSLGALEIMERNPVSLGELFDHEPGVAKRSYGPGTARPVVRGFDGDRVLVLQDGMRIGSLGSQSGDHGEPIDVLTLEKAEVVKGPAVLLYGSNAIGGVVNAVSGHDEAHPGLRGYLTGVGGSNNWQGGGSAGIEYGTKKWLFWANGGGQRAGDYRTPLGRVTNSWTESEDGAGGFGYYPGKVYLSLNYAFDRTRYGIPFDPEAEAPEVVFLNPRRHSARLNWGVRDLDSFVSDIRFSLQYNSYRHAETNKLTDEVNTLFKNETYVYQGLFEERRTGRLSGTFGFWGLHRDYSSAGEEALSPPVVQRAYAAFGVQTVNFSRLAIQFGGRVENNNYTPTGLERRSFTGFSGAAGVRVPLWEGGALVANYTHSYRAPALEELYNNGPHPGNLVFEVGDPNLVRERGDGVDLSLRHSTERLRAEANFFYYHIGDFVYLAPTGEVKDDLIVANYAQGKSRFIGGEARLEVGLLQSLWLLGGLDYVNAELTETRTPLPRIPPLRGRLGFEATYKGFRFRPELIAVRDQGRIFPTETRTAGYATFGVTASYTFARQHYAQVFSVNGFNLNDKLYRNHLSFIKDFAPEIGRGVRLAYTIRFF